MSCFIGIDAGTSGIKVIVLEDTGKVIGTGYAECNVWMPRPGWAEQNPLDWWKACDLAVTRAVKDSGKGGEVVSIGFSGQMQGCILMDKDMQPIGSSLIWMDQRAADIAGELNGRMAVQEYLEITASHCLPSFWAPKLLWIKRNQPAVFEKTKLVLFPKDYLRYRMTKEAAIEVSDASCTWLLDMKRRQWSGRMFEVTGIPRDIVPERLLESQEIAGTLQAEIAKRWGLRPGITVAAGGGDQLAGGIGSGIVRSGAIGSTIGTSGVVFGCCDKPFIDEQRRGVFSLCHSVPGTYGFLGCTLGAGGSYKWLRDTLFAEKREVLHAAGENIYDYMNRLAAAAPAGSEGLCYLPYMSGESTPHIDPDARGVFFGLNYRHDLGAICRSVMEGVVFSLRDTVQILREKADLAIDEVRAMGGGAKSPLWRQIQADVYNAAVITMNIEEGPAAGAAILGAVAAGAYRSVSEGCEAILKVDTVTEPIAGHVKIYNEYYQTYRELYPALKELYKTQAKRVANTMD